VHVALWLPAVLLWLISWGSAKRFFFDILSFRKPRAIWTSTQVLAIGGNGCAWPPTLRIRECGGNGDCAFYSMAHALWGNSGRQMEVRGQLLSIGLGYLNCQNAPDESLKRAGEILQTLDSAMDQLGRGRKLGKEFRSILSEWVLQALRDYHSAYGAYDAAWKTVNRERAHVDALQKKMNNPSTQKQEQELESAMGKLTQAQKWEEQKRIASDDARKALIKSIMGKIRTLQGMENFALTNADIIEAWANDGKLFGDTGLNLLYHLIFCTSRRGGWGSRVDFILLSTHYSGPILTVFMDSKVLKSAWLWKGSFIPIFEFPRPFFTHSYHRDGDFFCRVNVRWSDGNLNWAREKWAELIEGGQVSEPFPQVPNLDELILSLPEEARPPARVPANVNAEENGKVVEWMKKNRDIWSAAILAIPSYRKFYEELSMVYALIAKHTNAIAVYNGGNHWQALEFP
jgi:hypothetical protein